MDVRSSTLAVIPGLAPALVALIPQLVVLALVGMTLAFSPRVWFRGLLALARHPFRSLALSGAMVAAFFLLSFAVASLPVPEAGRAIPARVAGGFAYGDRLASRVRGHGSGPLVVPESTLLPGAEEPTHGALIPLGGDVVVLDRGARRLRRIDPARDEPVWRAEVGRFLASPITFELTDANATLERVGRYLIGIVERSTSPPRTVLVVLDGADGSVVAETPLDGLPDTAVAAALIDDCVVLASAESIQCFAITTPELRPRPRWRRSRRVRELVGLAGDEFGRFFVLDDEALVAGKLADGRVRELARFDRPARSLASRDGLVYVLTRDDGGASLSCIDPALAGGSERVWTVETVETVETVSAVGSPVGDHMSIAPFGIVLAHSRGLELRDRLSGEVAHRVPLDAPPIGVAIGEGSCFALLENDDVIRYSPALERIEWRRSLSARSRSPDDLASIRGGALVAVGDRLVVERGEDLIALTEPPGSDDSPWGQWRGGFRRAGTADGAELPLLASVLWRRALVPEGELVESDSVEVVPAPGGGWIVQRPSGARTTLSLFDADGSPSTSFEVDGSCRGVVRQGQRVLLAVERESGGRVLCLAVDQLRELWSVPTPPLAPSAALAVFRTDVVVSLRDSLRVLSSNDGAQRWESSAIAGARAPLVMSGRVFGPSKVPSTLVALELADGSVAWKQTLADGQWELACGDGKSLYVTSSRFEISWIHRLDPADGARVWERAAGPHRAEGPSAPPLLADEYVVQIDAAGALRLFAVDDGSESEGESSTGAGTVEPRAPPIAGLGAIVVSDDRGVGCLDTLALDVIWRVDLGATPRSMTLDGERIVLVATGELNSELTCELICLEAR